MTAGARLHPATPEDVPALADVLRINGDHPGHAGLPGFPYLEYLLSRGRVTVAQLGGKVVGFAGAIRVGSATMVSDLFVDPAHHGRGIGSNLLSATLADDEPRMTFSSADPRALPVYIRAGMHPWWPSLYVRADRAAIGRLRDSGSIMVEPATLEATATAATALSGIDRRQDFGFYASLPEAAGLIVREDGDVAAAGWAHRDDEGAGRALAHASLAPGIDPVGVVAALFRAAASGGTIWACIPGPHPALPVLLEAGARIVDRDTFCTSDPGWLDPLRILPNPGLL